MYFLITLGFFLLFSEAINSPHSGLVVVCILRFFCSVVAKNGLQCFTPKETLRVYFLFKGLLMNSTNYEQRCLCKQVPWSHGPTLAREPGAAPVSRAVLRWRRRRGAGPGGPGLGAMPGTLWSLWRFRPQVNNWFFTCNVFKEKKKWKSLWLCRETWKVSGFRSSSRRGTKETGRHWPSL